MARSYYNEQNKKLVQKIQDICKDMPDWFVDFIRATSDTLEPRTRFNYCIDCRIFLNYLINEHKSFYGLKIYQITAEDISQITHRDLEIYLDYLTYYVSVSNDNDSDTANENEFENGEHGKARKIASLRSIFKYLYKSELISSNPAELLTTPKIHEKSITRLTSDEVHNLLTIIENGDGLTERQKSYQKKTIKRDLAMVVLFLTSGIRVSELVGLNISDIDFDTNSFKVIRKGGNEAILYFGNETKEALDDYMTERKNTGTYDINSPLFISIQNKRITVRAVENLIKKYAILAAPLKKITPHKLRSTYGTMLYQNTGDIYLVADVLGHKDVNTTRRHYADQSDDNRRVAARAVVIRDSKE